jgi:putative chitobiose transport system permease protein
MPSRPLILTLAYYAAAVVLAAVSVGPALWLAAVAFSGPGVPMNRLPAPSEMTTQNFADALNPTGDAALPWYRSPLLIAVANSVIVTAAQTVLNVTLAAMAAFPLARMKFRGRDTLFVVILATLMIPEQVLMVPLFRTVVAMNLYDTLAAVVIPFSVSAFGISAGRRSSRSRWRSRRPPASTGPARGGSGGT